MQHWETVQEGMAIFLAHPILGAGIGAYMHQQIGVIGLPVVIHSTPVWLLAETGIVGFAVFLAAACRLLLLGIQRRGQSWARLLVLILCAMAAMSFVHELLYQRAFWILLGATLASATVPQAVAERVKAVQRTTASSRFELVRQLSSASAALGRSAR
jgi:O-antigen ligase